ncbi:protein-serine/threonine phosphatase [Escherichia coli]|jgi:serine/threonine protein phosphatase 2|uniref:protein-serine/threonine phosphatase n=2 Tax=Escherichia coli TaxID=562 RepID=UPI000BA72D22|nr:protein-serine/threonine phosphatase [Escherichia coli]EEZ9794019.1 protein-serine/threonine phosphatase [Escherichia coli O91]EEZ0890427.1 protein-serine/threonine phosphatase [Escherichia coli]EFB3681148.1 protein-serine/threonine phosphatase [Escherichia coli]EFE8234317.1 protein-serine/threonine phosphatase [Escherichia coli]EFH1087986.1 protein-serine/threonine phosphatase [Escherichia coli]
MESIRYIKVNGERYRRIWAVGDIHGSYDLLLDKLEEIKFSPETDLLISVGDNIDRGKQSLEVLRLLNTSWFISVLGNHEAIALDAFETQDGNLWYANGGGWYSSLKEEERIEATNLLLTFKQRPHVIEVEVDSKTFVIAHADYPSNVYAYGKQLDSDDVLWSRERLLSSQKGDVHPITGADSFVFGHMILNDVETYANQTYIDTGSVSNGKLSFLRFK